MSRKCTTPRSKNVRRCQLRAAGFPAARHFLVAARRADAADPDGPANTADRATDDSRPTAAHAARPVATRRANSGARLLRLDGESRGESRHAKRGHQQKFHRSTPLLRRRSPDEADMGCAGGSTIAAAGSVRQLAERSHVFLLLSGRHCEERKRRSNPEPHRRSGLLRFARKDDGCAPQDTVL